MTIKEELEKYIGNGIDINFPSAGFIFGNGVKGIIKRIIEPDFMEIDYCSSGNKLQVINLNSINQYSILDDDETQELKYVYKKH